MAKTQRAIEECGRWLAECLRLGWSRDQLDALEALWWKHHDDTGRLIENARESLNTAIAPAPEQAKEQTK